MSKGITSYVWILQYAGLRNISVHRTLCFDCRNDYPLRQGALQLAGRVQPTVEPKAIGLGLGLVPCGRAGHLPWPFVRLLTPIVIFETLGIGHEAKQILAVVVGGVAGVVAFIGAAILIHRRLYDERVRATSSPMDTFIICLLGFQLLLGLATIPVSLQHLDGEEMVRFMSWAQGIFTFRGGSADFVAGSSWIFKLHLFVGLTILLIFPFTRLVHMLSAPARYLWRPGYQIVRERNSTNPRNPAE